MKGILIISGFIMLFISYQSFGQWHNRNDDPSGKQNNQDSTND